MPGVAPELVKIYIDWLETRGVLTQDREVLNLPGREASLSHEESALAKRLEATYAEAALQPPPPAQLAEALAAKPQIVDGIVHYLVQRGTLVKLSGGLVISERALRRAKEELLASGLDDFSVAQFKDLFQLSRKWAIPILEHFDAQRFTRRTGNTRRLATPQPDR